MLCDVHCEWQQSQPPRYRMYVNDELFVERRFIWRSEYLTEIIAIWVNPGDYVIKYELVPGDRAYLNTANMRIQQAPEGAAVLNNSVLHIPQPAP